MIKVVKDVGRVCYESYDPEMYYNPDSEMWTDIVEEKITQKPLYESEQIIDKLITWVNKSETYMEGSRNKYLTKLAFALCRYGVTSERTETFFRHKFSDYPEEETKALVKSVYRSGDFGIEEFTKEQLENTKTKVEIKSYNKPVTEFWIISDKGKVKIEAKSFLRFIEANGFGVYRFDNDPTKTFFVYVENMIVDFCGLKDIKDMVLDYVEKNAPEIVYDEMQNKK